MRSILASQQQAFINEGPVSADTRRDRLQRCYRMIGDNQQAIVDACIEDFGSRSLHQSRMSDVMSIMDGFQHAMKHLDKWMKRQRRPVMFPMNLLGAGAHVEHQPKGVVGNIATWNFPVHVAVLPLAGIFAAGNRAMVKLSEVTPATSELVERLIGEYFDEAECAGITGGADVAAQFSALPFDHMLFTGATSIGAQVLRAAADNLTPVTLELGGKSPVIVGRSYDAGKAAERILVGKALNMGQVCLSPDYCFVAEEQMHNFVDQLSGHFATLFPRILDNPDYTSVVNARHHQRISEIVQDAIDRGGDVRALNPAGEDFKRQPGGVHKYPLTLIVDPGDDMRAMQEELFGPVLCVKPYRELDECIRYINARPRPLGLYYFGNDQAEERRVIEHTISGGVAVNDVLAQASCEDLPFGGIGHSGMGNYRGYDGFVTFSHQRAVYRQSRFDLMKLAGMTPPYGSQCEKQLEKLCRVK